MGIDPRLAVYARSCDGHYTTTRRDRLSYGSLFTGHADQTLQLYCSMLANMGRITSDPMSPRTSRMVDLMKIADNAAVPTGKQDVVPPLQTANGEVGDDGDASCVPTTPLESEARGADARGCCRS